MKTIIKKAIEKINYLARYSKPSKDKDIRGKSDQLREKGYVVLNHLVGTKKFNIAKARLSEAIEKNKNFELPCLSQNKISKTLDKDLIDRKFLSSKEELKSRNLTFDLNDIKNYNHMLEKYNPATLTTPMLNNKEYYDIWLDEVVLEVVKDFMGFTPHLIEAYSRRNFPSQFAITNHNWHRDLNHEQYLIKAFIFFTDCDLDTGAHHYIARSIHNKSFNNKKYYTDKEIDEAWPITSDERFVSKVPAGTIIIEDTRGLHKASIPLRKFIDLGYAVFLPANFIVRPKKLYDIPETIYKNLTYKQKLFIPKQNVI